MISVDEFNFSSNDLTDFFSTIKEGKKVKRKELNHLVGESFDDYFWSKIKEEGRPQLAKNIVNKEEGISKKDEINLFESNYVEPSSAKNEDPLTPLNKKFATLDDLNRHYNLFLSRIQQQLSTLGGGGESNLTYMDVPVTSVTTSTYSIKHQDYYIGVNYSGAVTIKLPKAEREGKIFIIKDELGEASKGTNRYITILPFGSDLIDGRDKAILAYDYGSLTFIWKGNSWRVV